MNRRALAVLLVLASACGQPAPQELSAATIAAVAAPPVTVSMDDRPGVLDQPTAVLSSTQLRLVLEQLLGEHLLVTAHAAIAHEAGLPAEEAIALVEPNTEALTGAIELVYGTAGAAAFRSLWSQHVAFFLDHAAATAAGRTERAATAEVHLDHYAVAFASFVDAATAAGLPAPVVEELLAVHVVDVTTALAEVRAGRTEEAALHVAEGYDLVADIGAGLAAAIAAQGPTAFPTTVAAEEEDAIAEVGRALALAAGVRSTGLGTPTVLDVTDARVAAALSDAAGAEAAAAWAALVGAPSRELAADLARSLGDGGLADEVYAVVDPDGGTDAAAIHARHTATAAITAALLPS